MPSTSSHARAPFRRAVQIALVVAWCALIYWFSDQPDLRVSDDDALDLVLRKSAHMVVFGVLAVLVLEALRGRGPRRRSHVAVAWLLTFAYAASDEWHQTFVDGRVGHASDVAIDMLGATIALATWWAIHARRASSPNGIQEHAP